MENIPQLKAMKERHNERLKTKEKKEREDLPRWEVCLELADLDEKEEKEEEKAKNISEKSSIEDWGESPRYEQFEYDDSDRREFGRIQARGLPETIRQTWFNESEDSEISVIRHRGIHHERKNEGRRSRNHAKKKRKKKNKSGWGGETSRTLVSNPTPPLPLTP